MIIDELHCEAKLADLRRDLETARRSRGILPITTRPAPRSDNMRGRMAPWVLGRRPFADS